MQNDHRQDDKVSTPIPSLANDTQHLVNHNHAIQKESVKALIALAVGRGQEIDCESSMPPMWTCSKAPAWKRKQIGVALSLFSLETENHNSIGVSKSRMDTLRLCSVSLEPEDRALFMQSQRKSCLQTDMICHSPIRQGRLYLFSKVLSGSATKATQRPSGFHLLSAAGAWHRRVLVFVHN